MVNGYALGDTRCAHEPAHPCLDHPHCDWGRQRRGDIIAETEAGWVRLTVDRMTNFHEPIFLPVRNVAWSMLNESVRVDGSLLR